MDKSKVPPAGEAGKSTRQKARLPARQAKFFQICRTSKKSGARLGVLHTSHGDVETPAFVPVATKGTLKAVPPRDMRELGAQIAFVNAYHLALSPGIDVLKKFGGVHAYANITIPLMSDSGGFQVFSLAGKKHALSREGGESLVQTIGEEGVRFRSLKDGSDILFSPELSIRRQEAIGADIMMAFDECVPNDATAEYAKGATERTHRWLARCIAAKRRGDQALYGVVQGGRYKALREDSSRVVASQSVDGVAIGGVSVGEGREEMKKQVGWVLPFLPPEKPRHLLGVGTLEDLEYFVGLGIDTFDCVEPTRLARHGVAYASRAKGFARLDLTSLAFLQDAKPIDDHCTCYACASFSRSYVCHLLRERELLAYYLLTLHNLSFIHRHFAAIRSRLAL